MVTGGKMEIAAMNIHANATRTIFVGIAAAAIWQLWAFAISEDG